MEIRAIKLITGEDVLGEFVLENEINLILRNVVGISVVRGKDGQPNIGFSPFPIHAEQKKNAEMTFHYDHIVYEYTPAEDFITNYNQIFGSGIIVPTEKQIITG